MKTGEIQKAHTKKLTQEEKELIKRYTVEILLNLISLAESEYPDSMLASLFKNLTKCKNLHTKYLSIANL